MKPTENFSTKEIVTHHVSMNPGLASIAVFVVFLCFFFGIIYSYGAAKLSYDYNRSIGNGSAFFWAVICYFFAGMYYPYYAIFLNPVSSTATMTGGRRHR